MKLPSLLHTGAGSRSRLLVIGVLAIVAFTVTLLGWWVLFHLRFSAQEISATAQHLQADRGHQGVLFGDRDPFCRRVKPPVVPPPGQHLDRDSGPGDGGQHRLIMQLELVPSDGRAQQPHGARFTNDAVP